MEINTITTRGLSQLEERIAELALAIKKVGEELPSNLADKFVSELRVAASKSSRYYIDIAGRKNPYLEDTLSYIKNLPENTLFTHTDIAKQFRHPPNSILALLKRIYQTDEDVDIVKCQWYYLKPSSSKDNIDILPKSFPPLKDLTVSIEREFFSNYNPQEKNSFIELTDKNTKRANEIVRMDAKKRKHGLTYSEIKRKISLGKPIAQQIIDLAKIDILKRFQEILEKKGYIQFNYSSLDLNECPWWDVRTALKSGRRKEVYKIKILKETRRANEEIISGCGLIEHYLDNLNLISPVHLNRETDEYIRYHPNMIRLARKKDLIQ